MKAGCLLEEMDRFLAVGLIFICIGLHVAGAKTVNVYSVLGKNATLQPPSGLEATITGVIWRHGGNLAAEWSEGDTAVEFYRNFKDRTDLDTTTGVMAIRDMTKAEAGEYSVEINNKRLEDKYVVKTVEKPPTPNVWPKPETTPDQRELECEWTVAVEAEPVTYWWNTDGDWVQREKKIVIAKNATVQGVETFSCKLVNIAGEAESKPWPNPFFQQPANSALAALAIIPIAVVGGLGVLACWKKKAACFSPGSGDNAGNNAVAAEGSKPETLALNADPAS